MGKNRKRKNKCGGGGGGGRDAEISGKETEKARDGVVWKRLDVGLSESALVPGNHYDDDEDESPRDDRRSRGGEDGEGEVADKRKAGKRRRKQRLLDADQDLEASGGEEMGFFLGLEVIAPDDYKLETDPETGVKRFRVVKEQPAKHAAAEEEAEVLDSRQDVPEEAALETHPEGKATVPPRQDAKYTGPRKKGVTATDHHKRGKDGYDSDAALEENAEKHAPRKFEGTVLDRHKRDDDSDGVSRMQMAWLTSTGGVELHPGLCRSLVSLGFWSPTPIQAATLPASILGKRNIVGCAPTGSGKTLAFLLPIFQELLVQDEEQRAEQALATSGLRPLEALVLSPTRELALQIQQACDSLVPRVSAAVVGGLAVAKQTRLLDRQPPIVVGTPGRLWDLISKRAHPHLKNLSRIKHLVVDEADRMIQQGSFPELSRILDVVHLANPMDEEDEDDEDELLEYAQDDGEASDRLLGLPGLPGEAKVEMLNSDILDRIEKQRIDGTIPDPLSESESDGDDAGESDVLSEDEGLSDDTDGAETGDEPIVVRRTYVYSATLTLPATSKSSRTHRKHDVDGAIAEILEKSRARGRTKIVDLTTRAGKKIGSTTGHGATGSEPRSDSNQAVVGTADAVRLPPGLSLHHIKCTQKHKDSHLYAYLMTTEEGAKGPCLVFCNSIAAVRRVGATLMALGMEVRILHAQMQQRARLKAVESLHQSSKRTVVVATDVAARGLDIPSVASVVNYDIPRTVDLFVHRSGRTARGVGEGSVGSSLSLVAPADDQSYSRIMQTLNVNVSPLHLDGRLLRAAQTRVNLACRVVSSEGEERKSQRDNKWFHEQAAEAGLEVDEALLETSTTTKQDQSGDVRRARAELAKLLSEPMQTQRYGKFLSTNSSRAQVAARGTPSSLNLNSRKPRRIHS